MIPKTITTLFSCIEGVGTGARQSGLIHLNGFEIDPAANDIAIANGFDNSGKKSVDGKGIGNSVCPLFYQKIIENLTGV